MIERIWLKNFRMLAGNRLDLGHFSVLVGRNASGKSTLMSALRFVSHVLADGVERAVEAALDGSGATFADLGFRKGEAVAVALAVRLKERTFRYELKVGLPAGLHHPVVLRENLFLLPEAPQELPAQPSLFGTSDLLDEVIHEQTPRNWRKIVGKTSEGKDYFRDESTDWNNQFRFGAGRSALGNIPEDTDRFPGAIAVRNLLRDGVMMVELDSHKLRMPSPPRSPLRLLRDGANLAAAARELFHRDEVAYRQWVRHVADAVGGLANIDTWERPEDKVVVLRAVFDGAHDAPVPSWLLSDGTLRLMALSLLCFAEEPDVPGLYLIEEPENGLHPLAIQSVFDSLSQLRTTQVFVATHSPVFLAHTTLEQALVFRRTPTGAAQVTRGAEVAELHDWKGRVQLCDVFASGVL